MHHDPSPFKKWTTEFEWQDNFTHRMSHFWHLPLNVEWRMANVLLTSRSPVMDQFPDYTNSPYNILACLGDTGQRYYSNDQYSSVNKWTCIQQLIQLQCIYSLSYQYLYHTNFKWRHLLEAHIWGMHIQRNPTILIWFAKVLGISSIKISKVI